jgi:uncharacterized protein YecE (DUF72 family)
MPPDCEFDEVVLFEVPAEHADKLWTRLQQTRLAWLLRTEHGLFVVAALRVESDDLARLLRDVQAWVADGDLLYVRFLLDGRDYAVEAPAETLAGSSA